jgi:hypothetical protein
MGSANRVTPGKHEPTARSTFSGFSFSRLRFQPQSESDASGDRAKPLP